MIKNWKIFNESDTYKLNKELIEDYFVPVSDLGYMIYVEYSVYSNYSNKWEGLSELPEKIEPIDLKDYTKFVLKEGSPLEQRSILECISSELVLKNKKISLI
jgi:hypothetical protein